MKVQKGVTNSITHPTMDRSNFASLDAEVANDISGTECEPRLVRVLPGKCAKGVVFVIKIANLYFEMWEKQKSGKISSELAKSSLNSDCRFTFHLYVANLYNKKIVLSLPKFI